MLPSLLVANRGEIAVRIMHACRELGVRAVAVYSDEDTGALHVRAADDAVHIGAGMLADTYLDGPRLVEAALAAGVAAVHPGYGFLSEHAPFCRQVVDAGLVFVGPPADAIETMGDKTAARAVAERCGASPVPGTFAAMTDVDELTGFAESVGYPVVIKAAFGGGGRGMRVVAEPAEAADALMAAQREAKAAFGRSEVYVERYLRHPRHIEVQVLADAAGTVVACGTRDCSVQRRHQKLLEEAPAAGLPDALVADMADAARRLASEVGYLGAGTVEFLVEDGRFYFLEMNTRIQVEHPVTEEVARIDLVAEQVRIASGLALRVTEPDMRPRGHAIELRVNAEEVVDGALVPSPGRIEVLAVPHMPGVRWDGGYEAGDEVSGSFDSLIGKLVVWGVDRPSAIRRARAAAAAMRVTGVGTTLPVHRHVLSHDDFVDLRMWTGWFEAGGLKAIPSPGDDPGPSTTDTADGSIGWGGGDHAGGGTGPGGSEVWIGGRCYELPPLAGSPPAAITGTGWWRGGPRGALPPARPSGPGPAGAGGTGRGADRQSSGPADGQASSTDVGHSAGVVVCSMQGTVVAVTVEPGALVSRGDILMVLEAMKMENAVRAPIDGRVREVRASVGATVRRGDVLAVVERT